MRREGPSKAPSGSTGSAELSDIDSLAVKALVLASIKCDLQADGKYGAVLKTWREVFYGLRKSEDADIAQDTLKKSFSRAVESLQELGQTIAVGKVITLTAPALQAEIRDKIE